MKGRIVCCGNFAESPPEGNISAGTRLPADGFTKALSGQAFDSFVRMLQVGSSDVPIFVDENRGSEDHGTVSSRVSCGE